MALADVDEAIVAYLGGLRLDVFHVSRDEWAWGTMERLGQEFMRHVYEDTQPPVTEHGDDRAALALAYPQAERQAIRETKEVSEARKELAALLYAEKERKKRIEHLRAVVTGHMGECDELLNRDGDVVATWRNVTTNRLDTTALKQAAPDLWQEFATETTTRRFVLT
jgi:predicted phage-related endonuclease